MLPAELLHGLTFAAMWAAAISYAQEIAAVRSRATVLGVVSGLYRGMGLGLGAMFGGYLYAALGAGLCFRVCSSLPSISPLLLAFPTAHSWTSRGGNRWREGTGGRDLDGWGDDESHRMPRSSALLAIYRSVFRWIKSRELQANSRKERDDEGDVVGDGVEG